MTRVPSLFRAMSAATMHSEITRTVRRASRTHRATILAVRDATPTVKTFELSLPQESLDASLGEPFSFMPGQWIDFFPPHLPDVGGFSITSTPAELERSGTFELAVRQSPRNPVAAWLHSGAKAGDVVGARVGGEFFWDGDLFAQLVRERTPGRRGPDVVFLAGGVGLTPLMSMVSHLAALNLAAGGGRRLRGRVMHSFRPGEGLFRARISELARNPGTGIEARFFVTGQGASEVPAEDGAVARRIAEDDLREVLAPEGKYEGQTVFLCGPNAFEAFVLEALGRIGVPEERTRFEKWW
ncbi:hypothetical protein DFJ74DRAFT_635144 [Hyaloraphidium curvatum]|nr:hypothetical protein DFJ74DRAFT_635144 [Hyaloraphidium curvatum]